MRAALLPGRTVRRVYQYWHQQDARPRQRAIAAIEFTDGSVLRFMALEGDGDYAVMPIYPASPIDDDDRARDAKR